MGDRRCGYCRQFNHTMPNCPTRLGQISTIKLHTLQQRQDIGKMLALNGFGIGAVVSAYNYHSGDMINCIVTQESLDSACTLYNTFTESRNIKYSKQVRTILTNYSGNTAVGYDAEGFRMAWGQYVSMKVTPLEMGLGHVVASIHMSDLKKGTNGNNQYCNTVPSWDWHRRSELVAPSEDGAPSEDSIYQKIVIDRRLVHGKGSQYVSLR